jgi:divalent metal cation (Fe/Co/Zn/Cd) transporter
MKLENMPHVITPGTLGTSAATVSTPNAQGDALRAGVLVEVVTVVWMVIEAIVAIGAGILAGSLLLVAFGVDSIIELVTGGALLWRLTTEARGGSLERVERAENRAAWITGVGLVLLCVYVVVSAVIGILVQSKPEGSRVGIGLAVVALVIMPLLAWRKRVIAGQIGSAALRADAACSITCAYMAATLLLGLVLNAAFGWWWADSAGALVFLVWLVPEAREAIEGARAGRGSCSCKDDDCNT